MESAQACRGGCNAGCGYSVGEGSLSGPVWVQVQYQEQVELAQGWSCPGPVTVAVFWASHSLTPASALVTVASHGLPTPHRLPGAPSAVDRGQLGTPPSPEYKQGTVGVQETSPSRGPRRGCRRSRTEGGDGDWGLLSLAAGLPVTGPALGS